jgi:hypothetical protein
MAVVLKPQDIYVLLKLVAVGDEPWSYSRLGLDLGMSPSEVHGALKRALRAGLAVQGDDTVRPNVRTLSEFLLHGIQYVFVPERGELTRGMPTAHAAPVMLDKVVADDEPPPVWPYPEGEVRGIGFSPLHKSAPVAARQDAAFYDLLALVDVVRAGRARERAIAGKDLQKRLKIHGDTKPQH